MLGSIIGAGASLLGGLFSSSAAKKQTALQKQFAQQGIQWKVADAKKAGIHPLYALGAQTTPYSPVQAGDMGISAAGQDIGRAIDAGTQSDQKTMPHTRELANLGIERAKIQNQILKAELASKVANLNQPGRGPGIPPVNDIRDTPLILGGHKVFPSKNFSTAETGERIAGEWSDVLFGLPQSVKLINDWAAADRAAGAAELRRRRWEREKKSPQYRYYTGGGF